MKVVKETDSKAKSILESCLTTAPLTPFGDSASPINEIIHPEESVVVASTESPVKKVVKRKNPVVAKPVLGDAGVITHEE
jgi:hypothetical protein